MHRMDLAGERKRTRPCAITDEMETKAPTASLNEKSISPSLSILPVGEKESMRISGLAGRGYQAAVNLQVLWRMLKSNIESADIIAIYAEYLDVGRATEPGLALEDACLIYEPCTSHIREVRNVKQVVKKSTNIIYTYIASPLLVEASTCADHRLNEFINKTFYDKEYALICTFAGLAMAILGENVGRAFWTIDPGGVGQSLLTTPIQNAINPTRGYVDCDALRRDDELRKMIIRRRQYCVLTATDEEGGREANFRNIRRCLYKKIPPAG